MPTAPSTVRLPLHTAFARPGELPPGSALPGRVAVLDLAFNGADPEADLAWARSLGDRLAVWIDHHDQPLWGSLREDPRFVLVPRAEAPACPPLVTPERVARFGPADSLLAHGDLDGVLSAAKWIILQEGLAVPAWLDPDSIAADTRKGRLTPRGERLDRALRASAGKDRLRRVLIASVLAESRGLPEPPEVAARIDKAMADHLRMCGNAQRLAAGAEFLDDLDLRVAVVNLLESAGELRVDLTELMLALQSDAEVVLVVARRKGGGVKLVASSDSARTGLDLREEFGLLGFAPFRVHVSKEKLLERLPSERLRAMLASV